jgi:biotin carboxyl carrier protein
MNLKPMSTSYSVTINNGPELQISPEQIDSFNAIAISNNKWHVLHSEKSFDACLINGDFNDRNYKVKVNNNIYNIQINNPLDSLIKELGFEIGVNKKVNEIKAPMPGLILDINIKIGQEVKENDPLLILEAMKMENVIVSPREGIIKSIAIEKGNAVDKNQLLVEFE